MSINTNITHALRRECEEKFPAGEEWSEVLCDLQPLHTGAHSSTIEIQVGPYEKNTHTVVVTWTKGGKLETLTEWAPMDEALWAKIKNHPLFQNGPSSIALSTYRGTSPDSGD